MDTQDLIDEGTDTLEVTSDHEANDELFGFDVELDNDNLVTEPCPIIDNVDADTQDTIPALPRFR